MEREQLEHGLKFTLKDFLEALHFRGKHDLADDYEQRFTELYCPPLTHEQVLNLSFNDLCAATILLKQVSGDTVQLLDGQTVKGSDFRYGIWYLEKMKESK